MYVLFRNCALVGIIRKVDADKECTEWRTSKSYRASSLPQLSFHLHILSWLRMSGAVPLRQNASLHTQRHLYLYQHERKLARSPELLCYTQLQILTSQTRICRNSVWRSGAMFGFWTAGGVGTVWAVHSCSATVISHRCALSFGAAVINTLRMGLLNCLNARSRGLTFRHRASCI